MSTLDALLPAPVNALPRDHLSASAIGLFARCPEQYRRRYVLNQKERPGAALVWGKADHYAHEQNFRQKIESFEDISADDVKLAFAEGFDQAVERDGGRGEVEWGSDDPGDLKDRGVALVECYHRKVSPTIQPRAVEEKFAYEIPGIGVPVIGYIDLRAVPAGEMAAGTARERVVERKTAGRAEKQVKPQWRMQGRLYQAATGLPVEWHVSAKTKLPAIYTPIEEPGLAMPFDQLAISATENRMRGIVETLLHYIATYGPDEPWPSAAPDSWANVCGFCGFRPNCAHWASDPFGAEPPKERFFPKAEAEIVPLSKSEFDLLIEEGGITEEQLREVGKPMFPGKSPSKLTDGERGELWAELSKVEVVA